MNRMPDWHPFAALTRQEAAAKLSGFLIVARQNQDGSLLAARAQKSPSPKATGKGSSWKMEPRHTVSATAHNKVEAAPRARQANLMLTKSGYR